jgi:hypothetical protein
MFPFRSNPGWAPVRRATFEFLVIVIGVLVALTADEWRQERGELQDLDEHLASVLEEVRYNAETVRIVRAGISARKIAGLESVIAHLESGEKTVPDPDALLKDLAESAAVWRPFLSRNSFDALKNSGLLRLARDDDLDDTLSGTYQVPEILFDQVALMQGDYPVAVNEFIPSPYHSELSGMRTYSGGTAPQVALDIGARDAVALIYEDRDRLLKLARGETAVATAVWYALTRILDDFQELDQFLAERLGVPPMAESE